ncbi:MAG TPA: hypothetical protein VN612_11015 [Acidobacteriaceae bacterium]|nr:hypothetical protein [Acidobacteriaceae bacterium]
MSVPLNSAERSREWRQNNPSLNRDKNRKWREQNRGKYLAHKKVENAVASGVLNVNPCERCGTTKLVHAHHDDYAKPLEVMWLCPAHHKERHKEIGGPGLNADLAQVRLQRKTQARIVRRLPTGAAGFRGVTKKGSGYSVVIWRDGRNVRLGTYRTAADAARVYDDAAFQLHGDDAFLNFPSRYLDEHRANDAGLNSGHCAPTQSDTSPESSPIASISIRPSICCGAT